jgi:hypothetical protein
MAAEERTNPEYDGYRRPSDAKDVVGDLRGEDQRRDADRGERTPEQDANAVA